VRHEERGESSGHLPLRRILTRVHGIDADDVAMMSREARAGRLRTASNKVTMFLSWISKSRTPRG
jgi:hypothetical protein